MLGHSGRDKNSHVLKQQIEKEHPCPKYNNFKIINSDFCNNIKIEKEYPCPKYNNFKIISSDFCNNIKIEKEHPCPKYNNFKIISSDFCNNIKKRKLSEALWINTLRLSLNKQEKSIPLKFFN